MTLISKPFKGIIYHWKKQWFDSTELLEKYGEDGGLGYYIVGYRTSIRRLGTIFSTSYVVKELDNNQIETRNSIYTLYS